MDKMKIKNLQDIRKHLIGSYGNDAAFLDELRYLVKVLDARVRDLRAFGPGKECNCIEMSRRGFDKQALGHSCDTDLSWTCPEHGVKLFKIKEWGENVIRNEGKEGGE